MGFHKLTVVQSMKEGVFGNYKPPATFAHGDFDIVVQDNLVRQITIESTDETSAGSLLEIFFLINQFCMICEGLFHNTTQILLDDVETPISEMKLLSFYSNKSDFYGFQLWLTKSTTLLSSESLSKWKDIRDNITVPHNAFLYMMSVSGMPGEMRTAFIVQAFEPLSRLVEKLSRDSIPREIGCATCGQGNLPFFNRLKYLIDKYGEECFAEETGFGTVDSRIKQLKNSRDRVMHLNDEVRGNPFSESEALGYSRKMHLLYCHILLQLIGIKKDDYMPGYIRCISIANAYISSSSAEHDNE